MYPNLARYGQDLQKLISGMDPVADHEKLVWLHGFFTALLNDIQRRIEFNGKGEDADNAFAETRRRLLRLLKDTEPLACRTADADLDSLERACADLENDDDRDDDPTSVPARNTPGPTGRSGGAAEKLPN